MIVDAHAYVGPWAFRRLPNAEPDALLRKLDHAGVERALVSATEAILYKDPQAANELLAARVAGRRDRLAPVAVLNPLVAGWEDDWARCLASLAPVALRLIPSYHGYSVAGPEAGRLIDAATAAGRPVFVTVRVEDERVHHPLARVAPVPVEQLAAVARAKPEAHLVLCGIRYAEIARLVADAPGTARFAVEISHLQHPLNALERVRAHLPAGRIWLGSGLPFLSPEPAVYKVVLARFPEAEKQAILGGNAAALVG